MTELQTRPDERCELREVLDRVGDRWSVLVMSLLSEGPRRYSDLRRSSQGISQRMLSLTLRGLERDGLVTRTVRPTTPPQVSYELTAAGHALLAEVTSLLRWAELHLRHVAESRRRFDQTHAARARLSSVDVPLGTD
ncbi:helix-turn-helix domain-containing protein [Phytohabitans flavus]|uniref:Transcriptional regulator n=1 Tax=Phytohabitans flavus TaxID=1076124 RepID=A0A6F8XVK9_9ACTN|nr:helix-turn-helix domain-containing protein [Phytohabitans flavus]BCB77866.1 transcriptional regulator [Phytohabitans flavus]